MKSLQVVLCGTIHAVVAPATPRQAPWLVRRPSSPPMTMGSDGPRSGDELREKPDVTRGNRS